MNQLYERQVKRKLTQRKQKLILTLPPIHPAQQKTPSGSYTANNQYQQMLQDLQDLELTDSGVQTPSVEELNMHTNTYKKLNCTELDFTQALNRVQFKLNK
ncbi:Hypothetical_protein [Hexamita inflata]|uniref:Hypothetical_protein n=1 Tax=Hexamita inflata TaxID=28002 RepID=A0AA86P8H3_9EUKA|nr:Hypothetical protein HINF_LOCUS20486 [Hexamita inflata]